MSKKRPGVSAAIRLSQCMDVPTWEAVSRQHEDVVVNAKIAALDAQVTQLGQALREGHKNCLTKEDLLQVIIPWKFSVGKPRPALRKHLESNASSAVVECTRQGIALARDIVVPTTKDDNNDNDKLSHQIKTAMTAVTQLAGVGPATASAILSLVRPDVFSYLFDEVIDCFLPKRTYTLAVYVECNAACRRIATHLSSSDWTAARVAQTLWTAARVCAAENPPWKDYTLSSVLQETAQKRTTDETQVSNSKRRRKR